jgi:serine/threonine protein kinase
VLEWRRTQMETGDANLSLQGGRYTRSRVLASGGMAVVYLGRLSADVGFSRTVAIKSLQDSFASDRNVIAMLIDEARLVARVRHPNVVPVLDVVNEGGAPST